MNCNTSLGATWKLPDSITLSLRDSLCTIRSNGPVPTWQGSLQDQLDLLQSALSAWAEITKYHSLVFLCKRNLFFFLHFVTATISVNAVLTEAQFLFSDPYRLKRRVYFSQCVCRI